MRVGIDDRGDTRQHLVVERRFHRIDQRDLVRQDQVGVIGRAALGRVPVEIAERPVDGAHPVDVLGDAYRVERCVAMCV